MTTKFLDYKICTFEILLSWRFPRKTVFLDNSPLHPTPNPPHKCKFYFYCRLAVSEYWGWGGFEQVWRRFFLCFFFSGFHLPDKRSVQTGFCADFWCADFSAHFLSPFLVRRFLRPFLRRFWVRRFLRPFSRRFSADFSSTFWRLKNRCSRVTQKCAENARKNARSPNGPARGGIPFPLHFLKQTARHTTAARPTYSRRACERPS